jgi:hypothetical protein
MVFCSFGGSWDGEMWLLMSGLVDHLLPTPPIYSNYHIFPIHHHGGEPPASTLEISPIPTSSISRPNALNYSVLSRHTVVALVCYRRSVYHTRAAIPVVDTLYNVCSNRFLNVFQGLPANGENAGKKATPATQDQRWVMNIV